MTKHTPATPLQERAAIPEPRLADYYETLARQRGDSYALSMAVDDIQAARDDRNRLRGINAKLVEALRKVGTPARLTTAQRRALLHSLGEE
jgi:hypothetical protein